MFVNCILPLTQVGRRGVTFEHEDAETINELPGTQVGMIAQEVEQVFPQ
jgi:hypothetical protein